MLNKLEQFIRSHHLVDRGDTLVCAVSGGADSMALLTGMYLLRDKLGIILEAAHFNHCLRGEESDADEAFVVDYCNSLNIPVHICREQIIAGKKGLEAAAREARYAFFEKLNGKIATAHTADDNAETVLMHLIRGTGLKGLGGISPRRGKIIRPMLGITRPQVLAFLEEYCVSYRNDSSNDTDLFLRNRLRHHVLPLLREENPRLCENLSSMALRLRQDEEALQAYSKAEYPLSVSELLQKPAAVRIRILERFLKNAGVTEPEAEHLRLAEALVFSEKPSSRIVFPGNVLVYRQYDLLLYGALPQLPEAVRLTCPGTAYFGSYCITCEPAVNCENSSDVFTLSVDGELWVRSRLPGDAIKTPGGTKSLKKLFIDRKIPAIQRDLIPVLSDNNGVAAVLGFGSDLNHRKNSLPAWRITVHKQS